MSTQSITRDDNFWYVKSHDEDDSVFDITDADDLTEWVDAEGGHIRSRLQTDANTGHLFYIDEERSGFLFIPHGDFDKIRFISLYKPGNKSLGFTGEKLTRAARVYITMYTSFKDATVKAKTERLQEFLALKYPHMIEDKSNSEKEESVSQLLHLLERFNNGATLSGEENKLLGSFIWKNTYFEQNEHKDVSNRVNNASDPRSIWRDERIIEDLHNDVEWFYKEISPVITTHSIVINPWFNSVRMYTRGDGPRKLHTGKKLDINNEVWNAAFNWISPASGQQPQGEKAFSESSINAHATVGRSMMGGSSS